MRYDKYEVYIGRKGNGEDGYFGNPYDERKYGREECLRLYKIYFYDRIINDKEFREKIWELKGKVLGCFCKPKACHGDLIVEYLKGV